MSYKDALKDLKGSLLANTGLLGSEQDTKRVLILPFIEALGYDTRNPIEFLSEVSAPGGSRVDYAILRDGKPVIIIECKPVSRGQLIDDRGQLRRYFNAAKPDVAILTNGIQYQFFSNLDSADVMDSEPFLEVDCGVNAMTMTLGNRGHRSSTRSPFSPKRGSAPTACGKLPL